MDTEKLCKNLEARGFTPHTFQDRAAAAEWLLSEIRETTVGIGGSMTVEEMGIYDRLCETNEVYWHWKRTDPDTRSRANAAKAYLTSANGVSEDGEIVNIDGAGNRVAATLWGPEKVYFIIGRNKVEPELHKAVERARNIAAPLNARRLGTKTPCAVGDLRCHDCASPGRICRGLVILMEKPMSLKECHVLIVDEDLGY